jgi:hypothetical protein
MTGDEPLTDGLALSVRIRRDFTVSDAARLLATARRLDRGAEVTSAADALFVILEEAGLLGDATDARLAKHAANGLTVGGWRAEIIVGEPDPLAPGPLSNCLRDDVFALPPITLDARGPADDAD